MNTSKAAGSTEVVAAEQTVNETIRRNPATVTVFSRHGIDSCCGGGLAVGEAARRHGLDEAALLAELREAAEPA